MSYAPTTDKVLKTTNRQQALPSKSVEKNFKRHTIAKMNSNIIEDSTEDNHNNYGNQQNLQLKEDNAKLKKENLDLRKQLAEMKSQMEMLKKSVLQQKNKEDQTSRFFY